MTATAYKDYLAVNKIDVFGSSFVFWQGFSDAFITKSPRELKNMFELISTSSEYRSACEELEIDLKKHQEQFEKIGDELRTVNKNKKLVSNQLSNCDHYTKISSNYERLELD